MGDRGGRGLFLGVVFVVVVAALAGVGVFSFFVLEGICKGQRV